MNNRLAEKECEQREQPHVRTVHSRAQGPQGHSAQDVSRKARKRGMRKMPVVVLVTLVVALGAGTAVGGPVFYDKVIVPSRYDAVPLEVSSDIGVGTCLPYKSPMDGITYAVKLEDLARATPADLQRAEESNKDLDDTGLEELINVTSPADDTQPDLTGVAIPDLAEWNAQEGPFTAWTNDRRSFSGVYLLSGATKGLTYGTPKDVEIYADGRLLGQATLKENDESTYQRIEFSHAVDATSISVRVVSSYPGDLSADDNAQGYDLWQITPY